jgi:hypothetical protein
MWLSAIVGGLMFGYGMVNASGCGNKTLVRIGGGNLKSLVVFIVMGISAFATLKGLTAVVRAKYLDVIALDIPSGSHVGSLLSSFLGGDAHRVLYFWHRVGNGFLTLLSNMFSNLNLTDMETCYKVFRREIIQSISIQENRFGFEPEITAKVAKLDCRIYEVGISYYGRTYDEGKKIGWKDGVRAIICIVKYNLIK